MKLLSLIGVAAVFFFALTARAAPPTVGFNHFVYRGTGPADPGAGRYANPVQPGFYPDPSICRVGDDYYLVHSTFAYFPGLPIFHSRDLVNWTLIAHALDRPSQIKLDKANVSEGLFAPAISHHNGTFYLVCTNVSGGGNFVVTATNPAGPWSEPTFLRAVNGIDPSLFFDDDGQAYLIHNGPPPENKSLYSGHRALWLYAFDTKTLNVKPETGKIVVNGGVDLSKKPVWIEGPHLIKRNGWYYLTAAEGGTGPQHSQVFLRSKSVFGPYEPWADNPAITQRDLDPKRPNPITCAGHCDFVQTPAGDWWAVFLACRPYQGDGTYTNLGRETFLLPVDWSGDWPRITKPGETIAPTAARPALPAATQLSAGQVKEYVWTDDFTDTKLRPDWLFLRVPHEPWHSLADKPGTLTVRPRSVPLAVRENPSMLVRRVQHTTFSAEITVDLSAATRDDDAGLVLFQNGEHYAFLGVRREADNTVAAFLETCGTTKAASQPAIATKQSLPAGTNKIDLRIEGDGRWYGFLVRVAGGEWKAVGEKLDGKFLSTAEAGGFVGTVVGPLAISRASPQRASAAVASPRGDANSKLAHEQLVAKAKAGGIDLYFLGDSITRRWGTSDPQWANLLANWRTNFFGWNAANFGWGADGIQHMLWRIQNGELDGVRPKVIVILAGTNNVGNTPGDAQKVDDIVLGLKTLVATCREKAPAAKIILTGIFPRNDNTAVLPEIAAINTAIAGMADGRIVYAVNINDRLADANGVLHDGMTIDKLHLTAKGYQIWADALRPILTDLLGPPAKTDHAPPPTGDPSANKPAKGS